MPDHPAQAAWMPDSRGFVEYAESRAKTVVSQRLLSGGLASTPLRVRALSAWLVGVRPDGDALLLMVDDRRPFEAKLARVHFPSVDKPAVGTYVVRMPADRFALECSLSPNGRRLAWVLEHDANWRTDEEPRDPRRRSYGLWVSSSEGANMVQVLSVPAVRHLVSEQPADLRSLRWSPDGRRLAFVARSRLYVCQVP